MLEPKFISVKMMILSLSYFLVIVILGIVMATNDVASNSLFDYVSGIMGAGSAGTVTIMAGAFPILALVMPLLIDRFENDMLVTRVKYKRKLLNQHFIFSIAISGVFTALMALFGMIGSFLATGHVSNLWGARNGAVYYYLADKTYFPLYVPHVTGLKVWTYILASRFLGIVFIAAVVIFLKTVFKKNSLVFFISLILLGADGLLSDRFSLLAGKIGIKLELWLSPQDQWFNIISLALYIVILYFICMKLYDKREFY